MKSMDRTVYDMEDVKCREIWKRAIPLVSLSFDVK